MRTAVAVIALALSPALCAPVLAQQPGPQPVPGTVRPPAPQLSAADVIRTLEGQGYRDFRKIGREYSVYKVEAFNAQGRAVKLYVDGTTGAIVAQRERLLGWDNDD